MNNKASNSLQKKRLEQPNVELIMGVKRGVFRKDDPHASLSMDKFKQMRSSILKRDDYTCRFCSLRALKFQEVHHIDDNHDNNKPSNLITACSLCHQVFHIWFAGHNRSGTIVYIPEVDQVGLNILIRTLWIAQLSNDMHIKKYADLVESKIRMMGQSAAKEQIGTFDAMQVGEFLQHLDTVNYNNRHQNLKNFHLLPLKQNFSRQIQYWHDHVYGEMQPDDWLTISENWFKKYDIKKG